MSIPESQLETWSSQGASVSAKPTHEAVRAALEEYERWPQGIEYEVYLQGSYRNDTNIRADSDVDVVVQLNSAFSHDLSALSGADKGAFSNSYKGTHDGQFSDFYDHVKAALHGKFGRWNLEIGSKSIKVPAAPGRLRCDVVPCMQFRRYTRFRSKGDEDYVEGMTFRTSGFFFNRWIINYPKEHYKKGAAKNGALGTKGWFKRLVRTIKNARARLAEKWSIGRGLAPSYFVESLVYNIPHSKFGKSLQDTYSFGLDWLNSGADLSQFDCQNGQSKLFGDSDCQWRAENARTLIKALRRQWDEWHE